jgi:mitochondrial fission protein ELM1
MLETPQTRQDMPSRMLTVWRLLDGKPGHEKQSLGLCQALARLVPLTRHDIATVSRWRDALDWFLGRFSRGAGLPAPDLIVLAGHGTQYAGLAARRANGGRLVAIMRPVLPSAWFDLCLIPEHDQPEIAANIAATRGALTAVEPTTTHDPLEGLILLGGPSEHYDWNDTSVIEQIGRLVQTQPCMRWRLTTSRRTPESVLPGLRAALAQEAVEVVGHADTPPGWVESALARAGQAWVTEDSVSMLYEALTAGCHVGLLRLPRRKDGRVARGVDRLLADGWIMPMEGWHDGICPTPPGGAFDESGRCARMILEKWFPNVA